MQNSPTLWFMLWFFVSSGDLFSTCSHTNSRINRCCSSPSIIFYITCLYRLCAMQLQQLDAQCTYSGKWLLCHARCHTSRFGVSIVTCVELTWLRYGRRGIVRNCVRYGRPRIGVCILSRVCCGCFMFRRCACMCVICVHVCICNVCLILNAPKVVKGIAGHFLVRKDTKRAIDAVPY